MRDIQSPKARLVQNAAHCQLVFSRLKEQDKRHVAGLLALLAGHGGVTWVAESVGMARDCVARGKAEVENNLEGRPTDRQRLPGGGRKPLEKKVPSSSKSSKRPSPTIRAVRRPANESLSD